MQILLATENQGKLREFQNLFSGTNHDLISLADFSIEQAEETGTTFVENALLKARNASQKTGLPCLADDSGLSVAALGGRPGIFSSRYAEPSQFGQKEIDQDWANNRKLLAEMHALTDRRAHFYCALVLLRHSGDPAPLIATGQWHGTIGEKPVGSNGFGYDPLFVDGASGETAATLTQNEKRAKSHRGLAWALMEPQLLAL